MTNKVIKHCARCSHREDQHKYENPLDPNDIRCDGNEDDPKRTWCDCPRFKDH